MLTFFDQNCVDKSIFLFNQEKFELRVFNIFSNDKEFFLTYIDRSHRSVFIIDCKTII